MKEKILVNTILIINVLIILLLLMSLAKMLPDSYLKVFLFSMLIVNIIGLLLIYNTLNKKNNQIVDLQEKFNEKERAYKQLNYQLQNQQDEIIKQMESISEQRSIIEYQKQELEDSIEYAFRIQQAILPPMNYIDRILNQYFIFYLPKSIVSGDFYFIEQEADSIVIAAVDCTGHGVPGAMMSVIGYDLLNQAVKINHITKPSEILSFVDEGVTNFLRQVNDESGVHDGMDISIVCINKFFKIVEFAGAYHELYYTHKDNIYEIKGNKFPIGMNIDGVVDQYTNHGVPVTSGDMLYLFSDGFADQFGGNKNKKYKYRQLKQLLHDISQFDCNIQKEILSQEFKKWRGTNEQVDDVLVIGVRV
ncbi:MAG: SpoIIE family protein phosphatase [Bacteroidales bacterium]|nr:SpoIIE family protein phosphatase [Bacteroidales bacterium]